MPSVKVVPGCGADINGGTSYRQAVFTALSFLVSVFEQVAVCVGLFTF